MICTASKGHFLTQIPHPGENEQGGNVVREFLYRNQIGTKRVPTNAKRFGNEGNFTLNVLFVKLIAVKSL